MAGLINTQRESMFRDFPIGGTLPHGLSPLSITWWRTRGPEKNKGRTLKRAKDNFDKLIYKKVTTREGFLRSQEEE